jgi:hypothetical protein
MSPLIRRRCNQERCGTWFSPKRRGEMACPDCREELKLDALSRGQVAAHKRRADVQATLRALQQTSQADPALPLSEVRRRLETALEPDYGQSWMPKLLTRLHGVFGAPEKAKEDAA